MANGNGQPGKWSWENLKGTLGDVWSNPQQLQANPWFQGGMGLLSASRDATIDPFAAFQRGMQQGQTEKERQADRERLEELRKKLAALISQQMSRDPDTAAEQRMQMSLIPGMPGSGVAPQAGQQMPPNLAQQLMQSRQ